MSREQQVRAEMRRILIDQGIAPALADEIVDIGMKAQQDAIEAALRTIDFGRNEMVKTAALGVALSLLIARAQETQEMMCAAAEKSGAIIVNQHIRGASA